MPSVNDLHKRQTDYLISDDPTDLVFSRKLLAADGAGGTRISSPDELHPQRVRVVGATDRDPVMLDGRHIFITKSIVGMPDLDVQIGDEFTWDGDVYEVVSVQKDPPWRIVAGAGRRAS